jgi:hypothetical protein
MKIKVLIFIATILVLMTFSQSLQPTNKIEENLALNDININENFIGQNLSETTESVPIMIKSTVKQINDGIKFEYNITNIGELPITSFYLQNDAVEHIYEPDILTPESWAFTVTYIDLPSIETPQWYYMTWYWNDSSGDHTTLLNPGESKLFGFKFFGELGDYSVANGLWSVSDFSSLDHENYPDPFYGQISNYTQFRSNLNSITVSAPTIVQPMYSCANFSLDFTDIFENPLEIFNPNDLLPIQIQERGNNYTKQIDTNGTTQHNSDFGANGCAPTALAWILKWWADRGVHPGEGNLTISRNNATEIVDLINILGGIMNSTLATGTSINATITGLKDFLNTTGIPLNFTYYGFTPRHPRYNGNTSVSNLFNEFLDEREAIALYVNGAQIGHAMVVTGVNTTHDGTNCGWRITVKDPWDGSERVLCMNTVNGNNSQSTAYVFYNGAWRTVIGFMAISPTNTDAIVNVEDENAMFLHLHTNFQSSNRVKFTYDVRPKPGSGTLIDTFALQTKVTNVTILSDFVFPMNWKVTLKHYPEGIMIYFHNDLFLGVKNVTSLSSAGFNFSVLVESTNIDDTGSWYVTHSGTATIQKYVEDSGSIIVPADATPVSTTTDTTTTDVTDTTTTDTTPGNDTTTNETTSTDQRDDQEEPGFEFLTFHLFTVFAIIPYYWLKRKKSIQDLNEIL